MPSPMIGRFFCLLGGDGSGKSTLLHALSQRFPDIVTVSWKQLSSVTLLPTLLPGLDPPETLRKLKPRSRAALFCYLAALEYEMLIEPALQAGKTVFVDSYWYKFVAKMRVLDMAAPFLYDICEALPAPDRILYLDVPPDVARDRKPAMNFFECNGRAEQFVAFQGELQSAMSAFTANVPTTRLNGLLPIDALVALAGDICGLAGPTGRADSRGARSHDVA